MDMLELIKSRRSTRKYRPDPVADELLAQVLDAGRYAPSGGNNQTTHFLVIRGKNTLEELAGLVKQEFSRMEVTPGMYKSMANSIRASKNGPYCFYYHAPVLIIAANRFDYGNSMADCACALENMMLQANALDLGSCWVNQLKWLTENPVILGKLRELGLAEEERVFGAMILGWPDTEDGLPVRTALPRTGNRITFADD